VNRQKTTPLYPGHWRFSAGVWDTGDFLLLGIRDTRDFLLPSIPDAGELQLPGIRDTGSRDKDSSYLNITFFFKYVGQYEYQKTQNLTLILYPQKKSRKRCDKKVIYKKFLFSGFSKYLFIGALFINSVIGFEISVKILRFWYPY